MVIQAGSALTVLRGLIDVPARAVEVGLPGALQEVTKPIAQVLGARSVAVSLHDPAWDDFAVVAGHPVPGAADPGPGARMSRVHLDRMLDPANDVGGAYLVPSTVLEAPGAPVEGPAGDRLLVPLSSPAGERLGVLIITPSLPGSPLRPEEVELAVSVAETTAAAVQGAQAALDARRDRRALELLLELSASLTNTDEVDRVLVDCCEGIRRALGFERVVIEVADASSVDLRRRASVGWDGLPPPGISSLDQVIALCDPAFEIEGCYLWPFEAAMKRVGLDARRYESRRHGVGPLAWDHHWLVVPLEQPDGHIAGWVWPDDPSDRLLPTAGRLRILRTFANQALAAVSDAAQVDQLKELARLDGLTGALNRRAFFERLDIELQRARRAGGVVTVVMYDLDHFKALNDVHGHPAGDDVLRRFTRVLEQSVRASDAVGRVGGDEFALILLGADTPHIELILKRIADTMAEDDRSLGHVRASYGTSRAPDDGWTSDELMEAADRRLYENKRDPGTPTQE